MNLRSHVVRILKGIAIALVVATLFGGVFQWLWNRLCPEIFHLPPITFLQAVGLIVLSRLFIGHGGGGPRPFHRGPGWLGKDDPRRGMAPWSRYGAWWKAEGHERYEAWLHREAPSEQAKQD